NVTQDYAQINSKLNLAVTAGGDIPDLSYVDSQQLGFFIRNGTLQDLTEYVQGAPWFKDLNPAAVKACTGPDGKIYCVPGNLNSRLIYYWKPAWPNGFPKDTETFLAEARKMAGPGKYAMTFKGSEVASAEGFYFALIHSFGGSYADAEGKAAWATPETVQAVEFARTLVQEKLVPDVVLAPGFENEKPFMDGTAAAFGAGSWSYIYLNPLKSPTGKEFPADSTSVATAAAGGELGFAHYLAAPGKDPAVLLSASGWAIPTNSKNAEAAKAFINYLMDTKRNADYAVAYGGLPVLESSFADPRFQTDYWRFVKENQDKYGTPVEPLLDYDKGLTKLAETINKLVLDPQLDILTELKTAQEAYNAGL
ncbi:MAG: extracellular solute-binding protein, partial [Chloroflexaceae bacterium]|nr:extracellular solute-binding protein [Chloroflexaceae bacterium]